MATSQENLLDWLRDAHAMEQQAEKMLKAQSERLEHYPQLKARIDQHIEETRIRSGSLRLHARVPGYARRLFQSRYWTWIKPLPGL